jgi:tetratricopeptide (TPR) repeat protein
MVTDPLPRRLFATVTLSLVVAGTSCSDPERSAAEVDTRLAPAVAEYVGGVACAGCHEVETELWKGSHHDLAMQSPSDETVLGDFGDVKHVHAGVTTTFFRRDDEFMVRTDGPDGELQDFEIAYTFGVDPLQQYLIELPRGRLQAFSLCWDTRPESDGGQRWFHLYPDEEIDHEDVLHWTGPLQNWNYMCAECHSTNLKKNYHAEDDRYDTSWSEIDVSCEACHGPGSNHVRWARDTAKTGEAGDPEMGLAVLLGNRDNGAWMYDEGASSAHRDPRRSDRTEIEGCARCHSRRTQLTDDYRHGRPLADTHRVTLLDESLYHVDGQILDEVYVYGSFRQSKMYDSGVTCTDCHDPHTAALRLEGNATCSICHRPDRFDTPDHHFHPPQSAGASCVGCHMPARNYMVVDPRHDHSFRVPRPDLSVTIGTPNACNDCHSDRDAQWAAAAVVRWHGAERSELPHYATAIHAARRWQPEAGPALVSLITDPAVPGIARATALGLLPGYPVRGTAAAVQRSLTDRDPLVRRAATGVLEYFEPTERLRMALPLLDDPLRTVRLEAARVLAAAPRPQLTQEQRAALDRGLDEYAAAQRFNEDRVEGKLNLGWLHIQQGRPEEAERAYTAAVRAAHGLAPPAINLADLYRMQGRDSEGEEVLRNALKLAPDDADLHHALGLWLVRQKRHQQAVELLGRAHELAPDEPRYAFVFAVAQHSTGNTNGALSTLTQAHERHPAHTELLFMLAAVSRDVGDTDSAVRYARRLLELAPGHGDAAGLLRGLGEEPTGR